MTRRRLAHLPSRPTWRCQACGIAWPCSAAKLNLLAGYREDRDALLSYLAALRDEAAAQLGAVLPDGVASADLAERFTGWASAR
ncbi:flavin reductase [Micromonospora acroterricola]|uniref:Flavin reductase n=1 Tax=Micromonospora acroterricola TaxID=2202421 RepID=A0A317CV71_9ACTN|nr:flavin reductase [Micromonospora acroterricola]PWR06287.1 flavin reductase [Micromonospora acroterricola]